jgi:hypothetical protein
MFAEGIALAAVILLLAAFVVITIETIKRK